MPPDQDKRYVRSARHRLSLLALSCSFKLVRLARVTGKMLGNILSKTESRRCKAVAASGLCLFALLAPASVAGVQAQSADLVLCDRVAADPTDPDRPPEVKGVAEIAPSDVATAIKFCKVAAPAARRVQPPSWRHCPARTALHRTQPRRVRSLLKPRKRIRPKRSFNSVL